jgi:hypothetical protein
VGKGNLQFDSDFGHRLSQQGSTSHSHSTRCSTHQSLLQLHPSNQSNKSRLAPVHGRGSCFNLPVRMTIWTTSRLCGLDPFPRPAPIQQQIPDPGMTMVCQLFSCNAVLCSMCIHLPVWGKGFRNSNRCQWDLKHDFEQGSAHEHQFVTPPVDSDTEKGIEREKDE